jgi:integrase
MHQYRSGRRIHTKERPTYADHRPSVELARTSIRFHDPRYTCATLLLSQGTRPKFVQELLGHATIAITLDTYSHVMPSIGDAAARAMAAALA